MFDVRANIFENTLLVVFKGKVEPPEMKAAGAKVVSSARCFSSGFAMITDIRDLNPLAEDARLTLQESMQSVRGLGMLAEVRIVSSQGAVTANQFQRTSRAVGYSAKEVGSPMEAERVIDSL